MKCIEMQDLISVYIDDKLDEHTKVMMDKHLKECSECRAEYEVLMQNIQLCKELPMIDLPQDFERSLHEGLLKANEENRHFSDKINWKVFASVAAIFLVLIVGSSMISNIKMGSKDEMSIVGNMGKNTPEPIKKQKMMAGKPNLAIKNGSFDRSTTENVKFGSESLELTDNGDIVDGTKESLIKKRGVEKTSERKVIKNASINLDIENYDEKFNEIINTVESIGGFIENSNTSYKNYNLEKSLKNGNITIRVPENSFIKIVEEIKRIGNVTNFGISGEDITQIYRDTVNEVENLKIQEKRLREIMIKADNVADVLEVERELTRVRGQINRMTGNIKRWDNLVSLSTIEITLNEIVSKDKNIQLVNNHVWEQGKKAFIKTVNGIKDFFEKSFVNFISILPIILLIGVMGIPVMWYIIKRAKNNDSEKNKSQ